MLLPAPDEIIVAWLFAKIPALSELTVSLLAVETERFAEPRPEGSDPKLRRASDSGARNQYLS